MNLVHFNTINPIQVIPTCVQRMSMRQKIASAVATAALLGLASVFLNNQWSAYSLRSELAAASLESETMREALGAAGKPQSSMAQAIKSRLKNVSYQELEQLIESLLTDRDALSNLIGLLTPTDLEKLGCKERNAEELACELKFLEDPESSKLSEAAKQELQRLPARLKWWAGHLFSLLVKSYSSEGGSIDDEPRHPWEAWQKLMFYQAIILTPLSIYQWLGLASDYPRLRMAATTLLTSAVAAVAIACRSGILTQAPSKLSLAYGETQFSDMVEEARQGRYDVFSGRSQEIDQLEEHFRARLKGDEKRSMILLAPPGEGKTALLRGLARRIADGDCAELKDVRIYCVSPTQLKSISYQNPIGALARQLKDHKGRAFVFIDEIHDLAAKDKDFNVDLLHTLKTEVQDGFNLVGASTLKEYEELVSSKGDEAWAQRTKIIKLQPMPRQELRQLADQRLKHGDPLVRVEDDVMDSFLEACASQGKDRAQPRLVLQAIDAALSTLHSQRRFRRSAELSALRSKRTVAEASFRNAKTLRAKQACREKLLELDRQVVEKEAVEQSTHNECFGQINALTDTLPRVNSLYYRAVSAGQGAKAKLLERIAFQIQDKADAKQATLDLPALSAALASVLKSSTDL